MEIDEKDLLNLKYLSPKKESLRVSIIYLILSFIGMYLSYLFLYKNNNLETYNSVQFYNSLGFIIITAIIIYFSIYKRLNKIKDISFVLHKNMDKLSVAKKDLADMEGKLNKEKTLSDSILKNSTLVIFTWDLEGRITSFNPYGEEITGYKEDELIGESWIDLFLQEEEKPKVENLIKYIKTGKSLKNSIGDIWTSKEGRILEFIWTDCPVYDENKNVVEIISFGTDITEQKNLVKKLKHLAYFDSMTGLPNKSMFKIEGERLIEEAKEKDIKLSLLSIDIDDFKQINDALGHDLGDELLIHISSVLEEFKGVDNYLYKLSEDEYAIILYDIKDHKDVQLKTERILKEIQKPWCINREEFIVSASVGIAIYPRDGSSFSQMTRSSNMAMQHMKNKGKNGYTFYENKMGKRILENTFMVNQIRKAIEKEQFSLHYQPIIDIERNTIYGAEALIRWFHPERGYIPPMDYIPLIEETGQIFDITSLVLQIGFKQKMIWNEKGYSNLKLSLNISSKSLVNRNISDEIEGLLKRYNIKPNEIILEITETSFMDNIDNSINVLTKLEKSGIGISLDDFGTGYSSLAQLKRLPVHNVKMDREFIRTMKRHSEEEVIVKSIIELAHTLGLKITAEGIETEEQKNILLEGRCDYGQGHYLSKPVEASSFEGILLNYKKVTGYE
ncbi:EAL domain-containing protein [Tissierella pigra]|uniref:sensor domain-containing protein n=1 Tax=Tissierella pigra TaxID=2607614 RepID=UPI001C101D44|nr:EAL domain-containing protein [Tissierella pigra]